MNAGTINFEVYENGSNFLGMAKVTLPDVVHQTISITGAGIAGSVDMPIPGVVDAMSATFEFTDSVKGAHTLSEMRTHILDLRVAKENYDEVKHAVKVAAHKYVIECMPKSRNGGEIAPASAQARTVEVSVISFKEYIEGKLVACVDPINYKYIDSTGKDSLAAVRRALGK